MKIKCNVFSFDVETFSYFRNHMRLRKMIKKVKKYQRAKLKFAFIPIKIKENDCRWLEWYWIKYSECKIYSEECGKFVDIIDDGLIHIRCYGYILVIDQILKDCFKINYGDPVYITT